MISPDGRWVATSGWHSEVVKVRDAQTGSVVKELPLGLINAAFFSPDGRTLVTGGAVSISPGMCRRGCRRCGYPGKSSRTRGGRVLPRPNPSGYGRSPAVIHLVDAATGRTMAKLEDARSDIAQWLGFTADEARLVAISTFSRATHVWDLRAIREYLAGMNLDWESHSYPRAPEAGPAPFGSTSCRRNRLATWRTRRNAQRRDIATYLLAVDSSPNSAEACNRLAWAYATAPERVRDPSRAVSLAERAAALRPHDPQIRNTLGVAYYRAGQYRKAADALKGNLAGQSERDLAGDLYSSR